MVYKLKNSSRAEVKAMLGIDVIDFSEEPRAIREAKEEGREEGREEEILSVVTRLLTRRLGQTLSEEMKARLASLSLSELEDLSEALLDFTSLADLQGWLVEQ